MFSDLLQGFLVITALIGSMLFVRFLTGTKPGTTPSSAVHSRRVVTAPQAGGLVPVPPPPVREILETSLLRPADTAEQRRPRLTLIEARRGIVLATILEPCRAHRPEEPWETERFA